MKEIKAVAPTPQEWVVLVRENENLKKEVEKLKRRLAAKRYIGNYLGEQGVL